MNLLLAALTALGLAGHWDGAFDRLGSVQPVSIDLRAEAGGKLSGTFDIPELGLYGQPVTDITFDGTALSVHLLYGVFSLVPDTTGNELTGENPRWKPVVNLHLKRGMRVTSYRSSEITVRNGPIRLAATLYEPLGPSRSPLVVIIPGSRSDGRAAFEYCGYGPMLAQQGIAVAVYDKRGSGASTRTAGDPTFADYAADANALVNTLRLRPGIDASRVGLGGASQGGWIAPLAARTNKNVRFLILFAGPAVSVERQENDRVAAAMSDRGASASDTTQALAFTKTIFDVASRRAPLTELKARFDAIQNTKPAWLDVLSLPDNGESLQRFVAGWKRILYDPQASLRATKIPVLSLFGDADDMVTPEDNVPLMREYLSGNDPHDSVVVVRGANHGLFTGQMLLGGDWDWPAKFWHWDRRAPQLLPAIVDWIHSLRR